MSQLTAGADPLEHPLYVFPSCLWAGFCAVTSNLKLLQALTPGRHLRATNPRQGKSPFLAIPPLPPHPVIFHPIAPLGLARFTRDAAAKGKQIGWDSKCPWAHVLKRASPHSDTQEHLLSMQGVLQSSVQFAEQGTVFLPDQYAVLDVLNSNTIEGTVGMMQAAPRLLFMRCFSHYLEGKPAGLSPAVIIRSACPCASTCKHRYHTTAAVTSLHPRLCPVGCSGRATSHPPTPLNQSTSSAELAGIFFESASSPQPPCPF